MSSTSSVVYTYVDQRLKELSSLLAGVICVMHLTVHKNVLFLILFFLRFIQDNNRPPSAIEEVSQGVLQKQVGTKTITICHS